MKLAQFFSGDTIQERVEATGGRTTGFDYMRITLSILVVCVHSVISSYGFGTEKALWNGWWRPFTVAILPMFFALSGFLVTGSIFRARTVTEFVSLRVMRIVPALFVEVTIAALILGPLVTAFPLHQYFTDEKFLSYPLNIVGYIHYVLPGVFLHNPDPEWVNRQLWTIPSELRCYIALLGLSVIGFLRRPRLTLLFVLVCLVGLPVSDNIRGQDIFLQNTLPGKALVLSFLGGVLIYLYKDKLYWNRSWFAVSLVLSYGLLYFRGAEYLATLPVAYMTVYLGLCNPRKTLLTRTGDYSYGLYLYGYPIQQTYSYLFPHHCIWWLNIIFSLIVGMAFAAVSWHAVEYPVLQHRKAIIARAEKTVSNLADVFYGFTQSLTRFLAREEGGNPSAVATVEQPKDR